MIEVKNLTKRYGTNTALNNVSFTVEEGTIVGFLGPNGAGKSTTMNIITGYLSATSGSVTVQGKNTLENPNEVKKLIGYLPELPPLYMDMTVKEYLNFMYELKGVKLDRKQHIGEICRLTKIDNVYTRLIGNLSKGYKQRVGIAQALLGNPPVLILDEPTVGLDPKQIIEIRNLIKSLGRNHTIILSSHILPEVQAVCERVIVMNNGCLVADGATDTLAHDLSAEHRIIARIDGPESEILQAIRGMEHIVEVYSLGEKEKGVFEISIEGEPNYDLRRNLFALLTRKGWPLLALRNTDLTLEEVFLQLTSGDASHAAPAEPEVEVETEPENTEASEPEEAETKEDREMRAIFKREMRAYFASPVGYVVVAALLALYGFFYYQVMAIGSSSYITQVFSTMFMFSMMIMPIITMRSMSDDRKNKTDQALITAPVSVTGIVMGKFLAAFGVYFIANTLALLPAITMGFFSSAFPWGILFGNYIGTLLYGAAMISIGVFISGLTISQVIAAIGTFVIAVFLMFVDQIASALSGNFIGTILTWISFTSRYDTFTQGIFSVSSCVYFISVAAVFVFLTARRVESRRWN